MEVSSNDGTAQKLSETLLDAVTHSKTLFRQLEDQARTIESLRRENEKLRHEIEEWKKRPTTPDLTTQLDRLFQQNVAKQAEIESLRADLRAATGQGNTRTTSFGNIDSDHPSPTVSLNSLPSSTTKRLGNPEPSPSPASKRRRGEEDDGALRTLSGHALNTKRPWNRRKDRNPSSPDPEAIRSVAEDGQDYHPLGKENQHPDPVHAKKTPTGVHSRLDALLLPAVSPTRSPLSRANPPGQPSDSRPKPPETSLLSKLAAPSAPIAKQGRSANLRFLRPVRDGEATTKNKNPLRKRPLDQLNLSHFKLNPEYEYTSYGGTETTKCTISGCIRPECCRGAAMRSIAMSLAPDHKISDDDLLLDFLGPGSEQKVATLTPLARENLLHEVRVKRVANEYGKKKLHRNSRDRAASPIGFWDTGMPDSIENEKICEEARRWERAEIERRYHEAQNANGKRKWVFADEI